MKEDRKIGTFLADLRKEKGLTQSQLASKIHVTDKAISRWENNTATPDIEIMKALAKIFDVTIDELYSGKRINAKKEVRKAKMKKVCIISTILLFLIAFSFLLTYFLSNYDTIHFYTLYLESDNFDIDGSYFITDANSAYLQLGELDVKIDLEPYEIYIELYEDKEEDVILYAGLYANVYLTVDHNTNPDNLYIRFIYTENKEDKVEEYKLTSFLKISNNKFFYKKRNLIEGVYPSSTSNSNVENTLLALGYEKKSNNIFYKKENNKKLKMTSTTYFNVIAGNFNKTIENVDYKSIMTFWDEMNAISYQRIDTTKKAEIIIEEFYYYIDSENYKCNIGWCNDEEDVIENLKEEITILKMMN